MNDKSIVTRIQEWQAATFGANRTAQGPANHLVREANELAANPNDIVELADVFFLAFDIMRCNKWTFDDILVALEDKLTVNMSRDWKKPDVDGVCEHVRG